MAKQIFIDMLLPDNVIVDSPEQLQKDLLEEFSDAGLKDISIMSIYHGYKLVINEREWNLAFRYWLHHKINKEMKLDIFRSKLIAFFAMSQLTPQNINSIRLNYTYPPMNMKTSMTVQTKYGDLPITVSSINIYHGKEIEYETGFYGKNLLFYKHSRVKSITEAELQHLALIASIKAGCFEFVPNVWEAVEVTKGDSQ